MNDTPLITSTKSRDTNTLPWIIAAGSFAFALGAAGMFVYTQNQQAARNDALQALTLQVIGMQQQDTAVTRAANSGLLDVSATVAEPVAEVAEPIATVTEPVAVVAEPAVVAPVVAEPVQTIETVSASGMVTTIVQAADPSAANRAGLEDRIIEARNLAAKLKLERLSQGTVAQMLSDGVLAGAYDVNARVVNGQSAGVELVPDGLNNTAGILADLIATSVDAGEIQVPDYIPRNALGNVDSQTLLFDLVQRSLENGTPEEVAAAAELRRRTIDAFSTQLDGSTETAAAPAATGEDRFYVVEAGDNLAYIALQFYGSTSAYGRIYEANRDTVPTPDKIQVGQRLRIPNV